MKDSVTKLAIDCSLADAAIAFGWHEEMVREMVRIVTCRSYYQETLAKKARALAIRDLLKTLEIHYDSYPANHFRTAFGSVLKKLEEAGLTRLDSICLWHGSIRFEEIAKLPNAEKLALDARILCVNSRSELLKYALRRQANAHATPIYPTIGEILSQAPRQDTPRSITIRMRNALKMIGFSYEDGLFLQAGTKRKYAEELLITRSDYLELICNNSCSSESVARIIADLAEKSDPKRFFE